MAPNYSSARSALRLALAPSGVLRATINLGNPVLAQSRTSKDRPAGVTVDLARRLASLLQVPVELIPMETPGRAGGALASGDADIGFLAIDPVRAKSLSFTNAYVEIDGCYLVRDASPLQAAEDVDRAGTKIVVGEGSAYALFLARELRAASLVHVPTSEEVVGALLSNPALHVAAGVRQQLQADMTRVSGVRLLPGAFMSIRQGIAVPQVCGPDVLAFLDNFLGEAHDSGFLADSFRRHGIAGATLLPRPATASSNRPF